MRGNRRVWRGTTRTATVLALIYFMVWGSIPAPALAEMAEEAIDAAHTTELTAEHEDTVCDPSAADDSDVLYAEYVQHMLDEALPQRVGGHEEDDEPLIGAQSAKDGLTGSNLYVYNQLRAAAEEVAAGRRTSTQVLIPCSSLPEGYRPEGSWSASDLGLTAPQGDDMYYASLKKMGIDHATIYNALVADCPHALFWFDKTKAGLGLGGGGYYEGTDAAGEAWIMFEYAQLRFNMYVMPRYSATGNSRTVEVKPDLVSSVSTAIATAQSIVNDPQKAGLTTYERLEAYKDAVCELVDYDDDYKYAEDSSPWQLISVFDGLDETNVVCEGYAKAFKYLCDMTWPDRSDIECLIVTGTMYGGDGTQGVGNHMWNVVRMDDGRNYLVDVTNCDYGSAGYPDLLFMAHSPSGSYDTSYTFVLDDGYYEDSITYTYDLVENHYYDADDLVISNQKYVSPGAMTAVPAPVAAADLTYNGTEQTGVAAGTGYTLQGVTAAADAGEYAATATLANGYTWSDGTTMRRTITWSIAHKPVKVTADDKTKVVGEDDPEFTATVDGTIGSDSVTFALSRATGEGAGEYAITPAGDVEQGNYVVTYVPGKLTVTNPAVKDISSADVNLGSYQYTYTGAEQKPVPTVVLDGTQLTQGVDFTCTYEANRNVGTAKVRLTGAGSYQGSALVEFEIAKAPLTVRAKGHAITYGDAPGNGGVSYEGLLGADTAASLGGTLRYAYDYEQYGDVGSSYSITPSGLTSGNYDIAFASGTLKVSPKPIELVWGNTSFTYDTSPHKPTATVRGLVNGDTATVTVDGAQANAGTHTATATSVSNPNYCLPAAKICAFTIAKAAINPTVSLAGWTYGETAKTPTVTGNPGNGEVVYTYASQGASLVEYKSEVPKNAGKYSVRAVVAETGNYLGGEAFANFEIAKAASSVSQAPEALSLTYTGKPQALVTAGVASGGTMLYGPDKDSFLPGIPAGTDADTYTVWYKVAGDENHAETAAMGPITVKIEKAENSLDVGTVPTMEMESSHELSAYVRAADGNVTYSISTALAGCEVTGTGTFTAGTKDGTCVVTVTAAGDKNHKPASKTLTITVRPSIADATISFQNPQDASVNYDATAKAPAVTVTHNGKTLTANDYDVEYLNNVNAGTASVRVTGKGNYAGTKSKNFTINRRAATVKAKDANKAYGSGDPTFSADVEGTLNGDTLIYAIGREPGNALGEYDITPVGAAEQGNYAVTFMPGKLTIVPASISGAKATFARQTYTGAELKPKPSSVVVNGKSLSEGADYEIGDYASNVNAGTATATIRGKGGYKDSAKVEFAISPAPLDAVTLSGSSYTYDGRAKTPGVSVKAGDLDVPASSYSVSYAGNVNAGTATVTVTGKGNFAGTRRATFRIIPAAITSVSVSPASLPYDGTAKRPGVTVRAGSVTVPASGYTVSYANNVNPGTATATVTGRGNYAGTRSATFAIAGTPAAHVAYQTHVQRVGWQDWRRDGAMAGTSGSSLRLEGINVRLEDQQFPGSIEYRTHVQKVGWQGYVRDGAMSGTSGRGLRLEAIQIRLTGQMAERYDVWYRVHAQSFGWMGWAKNDSPSGTAGYGKRLEGIEVRVLPRGSAAPGSQSGAFVTRDGASPAQSYAGHQVSYRTHVQSFGWRSHVCDGQMSGTTGLGKRLEGIEIRLLDQQAPGSIEYRTHVQSYGWMPYVRDGAMSGTSGQSKRLEAIQIRLTGQMAERYDVWYRVHAQTFDWMGWARNGQQAGTAGWAKRLECLEVLVLPKGSPAPGTTANAFRQR